MSSAVDYEMADQSGSQLGDKQPEIKLISAQDIDGLLVSQHCSPKRGARRRKQQFSKASVGQPVNSAESSDCLECVNKSVASYVDVTLKTDPLQKSTCSASQANNFLLQPATVAYATCHSEHQHSYSSVADHNVAEIHLQEPLLHSSSSGCDRHGQIQLVNVVSQIKITSEAAVIGEVIGNGEKYLVVTGDSDAVKQDTMLNNAKPKGHPTLDVETKLNIDATVETSGASECRSPPSSSVQDSDQLKLLSEQLCSLNAESAHITTHIHRRQTPLRNRSGVNKRQSLSTPRKCVSILSPAVCETLRSPRSTPRKSVFKNKTPMKVKFAFPVTPSKSQSSCKKSASSKKSIVRVSPLKFPTPDKKQTKRKLYTESPDKEDVSTGTKKACRRYYFFMILL